MLKASSNICSELIVDLCRPNSMVREKQMPSKWDDNFIISLFKAKDEALDR